MWCCDESGTLHIKETDNSMVYLNQGTTISDRGILKGGQPQLSFLRFRDTMLAGAKFRAPFKAPKSAPSRPLKRNVNI